MATYIRRREFIFTLGGAAAAWPLAARAQQSAMPVIGFLNPNSPDGHTGRLRGFRQGLRDAGYVEGENLAIEYRWADGQVDRLPAIAIELVRRQVAVIAATGGVASVRAAKAATTAVPIVFVTGGDPVRDGLVTSLNRPDGNITGISFLNSELGAKRMALMRELLPGMARVAVLVNPANAVNAEVILRDAETVARAMGLQIQELKASTSREIGAAFTRLAGEQPDALFVAGDGFLVSRRVQLVNLASRHAIAATYADRQYCEVGGLMSYGSNSEDAWRQAGVYIGRILKGSKPADLPVVQASKFELVINVETARMLGLTVPPTLLAIADEVIE
jgi:putative ABC transport system substrate-binding protein